MYIDIDMHTDTSHMMSGEEIFDFIVQSSGSSADPLDLLRTNV